MIDKTKLYEGSVEYDELCNLFEVELLTISESLINDSGKKSVDDRCFSNLGFIANDQLKRIVD